jgi:glycosyltransferase involved in cell wall biosynthesis
MKRSVGTHKPLKIVHLANHVQEIGNGIVNVMIDLACTQADAGHNVIVASGGGEFEALLAKHGVKHVHLAQQPKPHKLAAMCWQFNRLVMREKPDVVHAHMMTGVLIAKMVRLGRSYRIVSTVHNEFQRSAKVMGVADRVVAVGEAVARSMGLRGVPASRLRAVANGTIDSPRRPRREPDAERPAVAELLHPNVVTIAGMYHRKGIDVLIEAFSCVERGTLAHLYVVGSYLTAKANSNLDLCVWETPRAGRQTISKLY